MAQEGATVAVDTSNLISSLFALLPVPVAVIDEQGNIVLANSIFNDFFPKTTSVNQIPHHAVPVDGLVFDFDKVPLSDQGLYIFIGRDTSSEEQLRQKLVQMEKMGAIGRLVSGVAHELNNPLAGIVGYAQLLSRADLDPSTSRMVSVLQTQAERAGSIVQNFLNLATKTQPEKKSFDLNSVVDNVLSLREYDHKVHDIVAIPELEHDLPQVTGDLGQIEQVVLNLVVNAEDAVRMTQGRTGEIEIRTAVLNDRVRLEVTDNGNGIQRQDMDRIFDPFFTTKDKTTSSGGIGLGLNIRAEIVKDHGGELYAWSTHGSGSTFTMELPVAVDIDDPEPETVAPSFGESLSGKSIMVIDDEVTITELIDDYLGRFGAKVEFFHSGAEAFERLCAKSYDAVVCDQRMRGVNGQSLYRMVESVNPDLARRFIFVTGDVLNERTRQFFEQTNAIYLRKPFRLEDLLHSVQTVVGFEDSGSSTEI